MLALKLALGRKPQGDTVGDAASFGKLQDGIFSHVLALKLALRRQPQGDTVGWHLLQLKQQA